MTLALKRTGTEDYKALTAQTLAGYLATLPVLASHLGGSFAAWKIREVGDGNLNLVFIIEGPAGSFCVKQALPYVRLVGESWPLPLSRAHFEHAALQIEAQCAARYVPAVYHHDPAMALTVMENLSPHIILRKGLIKGTLYPHAAQHLGEFLALIFYHTSDFYLPADVKKMQIAFFAENTAMCKISEDLIFDEPYFDAPMNRHTVGLENIVREFRADVPLKNAAQDMKWRFLNHAEALLHGDLHTGSVMVTADDTRIIDPEFAFYGPIGFDVGALIGNFLLAYFSQSGHAQSVNERDPYSKWILQQTALLWDVFSQKLRSLWQMADQSKGNVYAARIEGRNQQALDQRLDKIWKDALGFAAVKMIRRILGLAHVEDMESIEDKVLRAECERRALRFARSLLLERNAYPSVQSLIVQLSK